MTLRPTRAIAVRDLRRYFTNPIGYVFITVFIFLSAVAAFWRPRFFLNNLANLDQINEVFPLLLLFFISALTMGVWADERKQGTDELLLTLPATDVQIVLGKYLAVVGIYSVSLVLSLSHMGVLLWLGSPDPGLMLGNYLGYWLAGAALIAVGMVGSLLTSNTTIAFVLAALLCSVPVLIDAAAGSFSTQLGRRLAPLGLTAHFADFARGMLSVGGILYFAGLAALFLHVNVALISRRHWSCGTDRLSIAAHYAIRALAMGAALGAGILLVSRADIRADVTAERVHSIGSETRRLITGLSADRPVLIQAYVSPDVPEEYVQERESVLNTLREIAALAPGRVELLIQETQPYTEAARTARERFGIVPRLVADPGNAAGDMRAVFLGVAFTSGADEQVIPFFEHGLSAEYELTRAIRVVARATRKRIGVVDTDARVFGGIDYESGRARLSWTIVNELSKQYDVVQITPMEPITEQVDALLVVLPSTLLQRELEHTMDAVQRGVPTLIVLDPVPAMDMRLAPAAGMAARQNPYATAGQTLLRKNTGDIQTAMADIGINWPAARIAWDSYRPHPEMAQLPREVVFVGPGSGNPDAFNPRHPASAGLQEMVLMYAGYISPADNSPVSFEPLLETGRLSGTASYFQLVQPSPAGPVLNVNLPHEPEGTPLTLAAHVRGKAGEHPLNVIVVADLDFISDQFFAMRENAPAAGTFDNVTFFLNGIDVLAGDESFVALRKRRVRYRTLERVEAQTRTFMERRTHEEQQAAAEAEAALDRARTAVDTMRQAIERRTDVDAQAKQIMVRNLEETETRKLQVLRINTEQARDAKIQASRETMEREVRRIQGTIRTTAVLLPPIPVLLMGVAILLQRRRLERAGAAAVHRLRDAHD